MYFHGLNIISELKKVLIACRSSQLVLLQHFQQASLLVPLTSSRSHCRHRSNTTLTFLQAEVSTYLLWSLSLFLMHVFTHPVFSFFLNHNGAFIFKHIHKNKIKLHNFFFHFAIINHHHSSDHKYPSHYRSTIQTSPQVI